ncbi:hypothetical protein Tco_0968186 [Tanacetum coccineum]
MDPMISLGQKNTLAEYMILFGADNRPPMLDKDLYDSWKSRMELYMQNREHERIILESVEHGPLIWPTVEENGVIRTKKYAELSAAEKIQADCDMKATNIILQDEMEYFQIQVNTKFLNSLPPEWSKFVTDVKLIPLAFAANQTDDKPPPHSQHFINTSYNNPQLQQQFSPSQHASIQPNQHYSSHYPIPHKESSIQSFIHSTITYISVSNESSNLNCSTNSGFVVPVFSLGDDPIACLNKAIAFLMVVASSRFPTTNNQLKTSSNPTNQATIQDGKGNTMDMQELLNATTAKVKDIWLGNALSQSDQGMQHDYDDLSTQAVLMANISNYGSDIILEVPNFKTYLNDMDNQSVHALQDFEQSLIMITNTTISSDSNIIPYSQYLQETQQATVRRKQCSTTRFNDFILDVPSELLKVSLVNASLKKLKFHLTQFDSVVKKRTTPSALEEGEWGFEHTKAVFNNEIIPFLKYLKDIFNVFDKDRLNEITEVQTVFDQMEASVQQFSVDKKCLEIAKKEILLENNRLLQKVMSQAYNDLSKIHSQLEKHCISLEVSMHLKQEVFQNDESCVNQNAVEIQTSLHLVNGRRLGRSSGRGADGAPMRRRTSSLSVIGVVRHQMNMVMKAWSGLMDWFPVVVGTTAQPTRLDR